MVHFRIPIRVTYKDKNLRFSVSEWDLLRNFPSNIMSIIKDNNSDAEKLIRICRVAQQLVPQILLQLGFDVVLPVKEAQITYYYVDKTYDLPDSTVVMYLILKTKDNVVDPGASNYCQYMIEQMTSWNFTPVLSSYVHLEGDAQKLFYALLPQANTGKKMCDCCEKEIGYGMTFSCSTCHLKFDTCTKCTRDNQKCASCKYSNPKNCMYVATCKGKFQYNDNWVTKTLDITEIVPKMNESNSKFLLDILFHCQLDLGYMVDQTGKVRCFYLRCVNSPLRTLDLKVRYVGNKQQLQLFVPIWKAIQTAENRKDWGHFRILKS